MSERTDITDQIDTLEAERAGLILMDEDLHKRFQASPSGSDEEREIGAALDKIDARLDEIGDDLGALRAQLYLVDSAASRREKLANAAYGRMQ